MVSPETSTPANAAKCTIANISKTAYLPSFIEVAYLHKGLF